MFRAHKFGLTKKKTTCMLTKEALKQYYARVYLGDGNLKSVFICTLWAVCLVVISNIYDIDVTMSMSVIVGMTLFGELFRPFIMGSDNVIALYYSLHYLKYFPLTEEEIAKLHITTKLEYTVFVNLFMAVPSWMSKYSFNYHIDGGRDILESQQKEFSDYKINSWVEMRDTCRGVKGVELIEFDDEYCTLGECVLTSMQSALGYFNDISVILKAFDLFASYDVLNLYYSVKTLGADGLSSFKPLKNYLIKSDFYEKTLVKFIYGKHRSYDKLGLYPTNLEAIRKQVLEEDSLEKDLKDE